MLILTEPTIITVYLDLATNQTALEMTLFRVDTDEMLSMIVKESYYVTSSGCQCVRIPIICNSGEIVDGCTTISVPDNLKIGTGIGAILRLVIQYTRPDRNKSTTDAFSTSPSITFSSSGQDRTGGTSPSYI